MTRYTWMYHLGIRPWERYGKAAAASIAALLDREEYQRSRPLGRALDLGCGRGQYTPELARRGWQAWDSTTSRPRSRRRPPEARAAPHMWWGTSNLPAYGLGTFDLFLDVGCFQGLTAEQRDAEGAGVTALANPGATLLMLAFGPTLLRSLLEGVSQTQVETAFQDWDLLTVENADTRGLGWPMNQTRPKWCRLRPRLETHRH